MAEQVEFESERMWEPEMPVIWLVRDTKGFALDGKTSHEDTRLNFRLSYQEWLAIYLDALEVDKTGYEKWRAQRATSGPSDVPTVLTEIEDDIPDFPLLSRIRGPYHDVVFENNELEDLYKECLRVQRTTSNARALEGLQKLIEADYQARRLGLSMYFVSN